MKYHECERIIKPQTRSFGIREIAFTRKASLFLKNKCSDFSVKALQSLLYLSGKKISRENIIRNCGHYVRARNKVRNR